VTVTGGKVMQYRILLNPDRLAAMNLTVVEVVRALEKAAPEGSDAAAPGVAQRGTRRLGKSAQDLAEVVITAHGGIPVRLKDVAEIRLEPSAPAGEPVPEAQKQPPSEPAVILAISMRPGEAVSTWRRDVDRKLTDLMKLLPPGLVIERKIPNQLAGLVELAAAEIRRDLPPDWTVEKVASEREGTVLVPKRPPQLVKVVGPDRIRLNSAAKDLSDRLRAIPGVSEVQVEPQGMIPDVEFRIDRERAAKSGVPVADISDTIEVVRSGRVVGRVEGPAGGSPGDIVVACLGPRDRDVREVARARVRGASGEVVSVDSLAAIRATDAPRALYREDGQPAVLVFYRVRAEDQARAQRDVQEAILAAERRLRESSGDYRVKFDKAR
jgi:Cu/Ag efflux pump CusA